MEGDIKTTFEYPTHAEQHHDERLLWGFTLEERWLAVIVAVLACQILGVLANG